MKRLAHIIACGIAIASPLLLVPAHSEQASAADCMDSATTNPEFSHCTEGKIKAADDRLNLAWKRLYQFEGGSRTPRGRALLSEQRAWLAFRSKACAEYFTLESGREEQVIHGPICIAEIINTRADDLNGRFELMNPN